MEVSFRPFIGSEYFGGRAISNEFLLLSLFGVDARLSEGEKQERRETRGNRIIG
jgi:hypothetical protein